MWDAGKYLTLIWEGVNALGTSPTSSASVGITFSSLAGGASTGLIYLMTLYTGKFIAAYGTFGALQV
ncbi:hypothetical protein OG21DRAFT_1505786 [Imleria badia]|nr:hypothetical protein OG21DRAFT_1505786 [Imleria badia]